MAGNNENNPSVKQEKKPYFRPRAELMNDKAKKVFAAPPVPAAAQASPIAPGATVF